MLSTVLSFGIKSVHQFAAERARRNDAASRHPLAAYPCLHHLIVEAERSGTLAEERRRLMRNQSRAA